MNNRNLNQKIINAMVVGICLFISIYVAAQIFTSTQNTLSTLVTFFGVALCLICLVSPKYGFYIFIALCGYLDFIKRLLVFFGVFGYMDITKILAIGPALTAALFISFFTRGALRLVKLTKLDIWATIAAIIALIGGFAVYSSQYGLGLLALSNTANIVGFAFLFPVITNTFSTQNELYNLFKFIKIVYVPVAIYGIWQGIFGLSDFEITYLKAGFTMVVDQLNAEHVRAFSTLNSSTALTTIMSLLAIISLVPIFTVPKGKKLELVPFIGSLFLFCLYVIAGFMSLSRSGYAIWIGAIIAYWFFKTKFRTQILYFLAVATFGTMIAMAPYLLRHITELDPSQYVKSSYGEDVTDIQTYSDRLMGFENLTRSTAMYSPFGLSKDDVAASMVPSSSSLTYHHDALSGALISYGVIPVLFILFALAWMLIRLHGTLLRIPKGPRRNFATLLIALMFGEMIPNVTSGAYLGVFPNNVFFWLMMGAASALLFKIKEPETIQPQPAVLVYEKAGI